MKNAHAIIEHLFVNPCYKKVTEHRCFARLRSLLPKTLREVIAFMYKKNSTLFIAVTHPAMKMEFNYKLNLINTLLKEMARISPECDLGIRETKVFVTNKTSEALGVGRSSFVSYKEHARGNFENLAKDPTLFGLFEKIRTIISLTSHETA